MKILFYDTKKYDQVSFEHERKDFPGIEIDFLETDLNRKTAKLAAGYEAVCAFVNSRIGEDTVNILADCGAELLLMRCAGFNNVDLAAAEREEHYGAAGARLFPGSSGGTRHGSHAGCMRRLIKAILRSGRTISAWWD